MNALEWIEKAIAQCDVHRNSTEHSRSVCPNTMREIMEQAFSDVELREQIHGEALRKIVEGGCMMCNDGVKCGHHCPPSIAQSALEDAQKKGSVNGGADLRTLARQAMEVIDDELENRPARHSLGKLHAGLQAALKE